ncbi:PDZ domain-containing protein [Flexithrix dorotheae]|uniref:PDZ domain-containing protein n=1 Tax=Flexithrix dorotheae TaxID=70993 RepID=UPI00036916EA|nr:PDZ domain-containing protein [Flexithrix dorotheae]
MKKIILINFSILMLLVFNPISAQDLGRRASWQAKIAEPSFPTPGALVNSIEKNSPLHKNGIQSGDIILKVDDILANSSESWWTITYGLRAGKPVEILVKRGITTFSKTIIFPGMAKESHENIETIYTQLTSDYGITQRVIITKPKGQSDKQPAIFFLSGLSCSSIELYPGRNSNWGKVINDIVEKSGMVVLRIEKPGVGDSDGDCASTDFHTEKAGYHAAIAHLKSLNFVDTNRIIVYGSSMGSALAPLFANEYGLAGVISDGTFFKTWFEHMLEIERRIRQMQGDSEAEIVEKMNTAFIPLYYGMLIGKKSYEEIIQENPAIAQYNYHGLNHMYGRPLSYYQQLQDFNLAGEWEKLKVPVKIMRGTNDWIMSSFDNQMIMEVLARNGNQQAELYEFPGLDHWNTIHEKPADSFFGNPGKWDQNISDIIVQWAKELANNQVK